MNLEWYSWILGVVDSFSVRPKDMTLNTEEIEDPRHR